MHCLAIILQYLGKYENIIQVHNSNPLYYKISKIVIYHMGLLVIPKNITKGLKSLVTNLNS